MLSSVIIQGLDGLQPEDCLPKFSPSHSIHWKLFHNWHEACGSHKYDQPDERGFSKGLPAPTKTGKQIKVQGFRKSSSHWHQFKRNWTKQHLPQVRNRSGGNLAFFHRVSLASWPHSSTSVWFRPGEHTFPYQNSSPLRNSFDLIGEIWAGFYHGTELDEQLCARENTGKWIIRKKLISQMIFRASKKKKEKKKERKKWKKKKKEKKERKKNNLQANTPSINKHWVNIITALGLTDKRRFLFRQRRYDCFGMRIFKVYFQQFKFTVTAPNWTGGDKFLCPVSIFTSELPIKRIMNL